MFNDGKNIVIEGGSFTQINHFTKALSAFDQLIQAVSPNAFHNSGERRDPPKCHLNTRVALIEKLMEWIMRLDPETMNSLIMWLYGPAGAGKSAIAQTLTDRCFEEGILLASYFFSRFDPTRNHAKSLIATIVYQAYCRFTAIRKSVEAAIDANPLIFTQSLATQINALIVEPFRSFVDSGYFNDPKTMRLIVIDGLDECEDRRGQIEILHAISGVFRHSRLPFKFLIVSRPEHDIRLAFGAGDLGAVTAGLPLDDNYKPWDDIKLFLHDKFAHIKQIHPLNAYIPPDWPTDEVLESIVRKSSGQFIYAATVAKFVESTRHRPTDRLEVVLGLRPPTSNRDIPFSELDELYRHIISAVDDVQGSIQVLAFIMLQGCRTVYHFDADGIDHILSLRPGGIHLLLCDLHSLVDVTYRYPRLLHASLEDFFRDKSRSKDLHIDAPLYHAKFACKLFRHLKEIPTSKAFHVWHFVEEFPSHIKHALPTNELRQEIMAFNVIQCLGQKFPLYNGGDMIPILLHAIRNSYFHDAKELHDSYMKQFNDYANKQIEVYRSDPRLYSLIAVASCGIHAELGKDLCHPHRLLLGISESTYLVDSRSLRIFDAMRPRWNNHYGHFLYESLNDAARWGQNVVGSSMYAAAALHLLRYLCDHSLQPSKARHRSHKRSFLKYKPWHYRYKRAWRAERRDRVIRNAAKCIRPINFWVRKRFLYEIKDMRWRAFIVGLGYLHKMLGKAGRSEALIEFSRRRIFGPISQTVPEKSKAARSAITRYLERMNADEDWTAEGLRSPRDTGMKVVVIGIAPT